MKTEIRYIELKTCFSDNGPAWIGKVKLSKSGRTIYFNNKAFRKAIEPDGNYYDVETGDIYWISCVKKNGHDRHWAGSGKVIIDSTIVTEYLEIVGQKQLKSNFQVKEITEIYPIDRIKALENNE